MADTPKPAPMSDAQRKKLDRLLKDYGRKATYETLSLLDSK
jgi:hypothetical protein